MTVSLLVDNDVVIKLARMDCFPSGMTALGRSANQIGSIFHMLRYMGIASEQRRFKFCSSQAEADRLQAALASIVHVELTIEEAKAAAEIMATALENGHDLDEGETALMAVAIAREKMEIATGDKRALLSLAPMERLEPRLSVLRGRLICLEQIFFRLASVHGGRVVTNAVRTCTSADDTINFIAREFGRDQTHVGPALEHLVREQIDREAPGWLKPIR